MSSTIAPSWPCVLRTPSETLYKGCPTTAVHCWNRVCHTLPLAAVETPLIYEIVRERIRGFRTTLPAQQHPSIASGVIEIEYVRIFGLVSGRARSKRDRIGSTTPASLRLVDWD